jgi:hypothetical protein
MTEPAKRDFLTAAVKVLRATGRPMTSEEIARAALDRGLLATSGKTPERTMSARLYVAARYDVDCPVERVFEAGAGRARRGSVRWRLKGQS